MVWAIVIACLLLVPGSILETDWLDLPFRVDGIVHASLFFVLALLVQRAMGSRRRSALAPTLFGGIAYALLLEILQIPVPRRSFELVDVFASGLGIMAAFAARAVVVRFRQNKLQNSGC
jgi:VanZ family protein